MKNTRATASRFASIFRFFGLTSATAQPAGPATPSPSPSDSDESAPIWRVGWIALRSSQCRTAAAIPVLCALSIWGTVRGFGPFATLPHHQSLILLQAVIGIGALMALALWVIVSEHRKIETELRRLATTDPLTGLANYGKFMDNLQLEIKRSERTERPFAILLVDVDELKLLNDHEGHVAGNEALCKVADVMRASCRSIDTIARFGGDEFALILPEAEEEAARQVRNRIVDQLATRFEGPRVTVSIGIAVYHRLGQSIESLLSTADAALYQGKSRRNNKRPADHSSVNVSAALLELGGLGDRQTTKHVPEHRH
jgi:diguanylate cyclase (GGDEF)-like protein